MKTRKKTRMQKILQKVDQMKGRCAISPAERKIRSDLAEEQEKDSENLAAFIHNANVAESEKWFYRSRSTKQN